MLHYDRIDISEGTDLAKSNNSKECMNCLYFFSNHGYCVSVALFIILANLKQQNYLKVLYLKIVGIYKNI